MSETLVRTTVNGRPIEARIPTRMLLVEFLRDRLGLTGTKVSCGMQVCGACTVFVDERPVMRARISTGTSSPTRRWWCSSRTASTSG